MSVLALRDNSDNLKRIWYKFYIKNCYKIKFTKLKAFVNIAIYILVYIFNTRNSKI